MNVSEGYPRQLATQVNIAAAMDGDSGSGAGRSGDSTPPSTHTDSFPAYNGAGSGAEGPAAPSWGDTHTTAHALLQCAVAACFARAGWRVVQVGDRAVDDGGSTARPAAGGAAGGAGEVDTSSAADDDMGDAGARAAPAGGVGAADVSPWKPSKSGAFPLLRLRHSGREVLLATLGVGDAAIVHVDCNGQLRHVEFRVPNISGAELRAAAEAGGVGSMSFEDVRSRVELHLLRAVAPTPEAGGAMDCVLRATADEVGGDALSHVLAFLDAPSLAAAARASRALRAAAADDALWARLLLHYFDKRVPPGARARDAFAEEWRTRQRLQRERDEARAAHAARRPRYDPLWPDGPPPASPFAPFWPRPPPPGAPFNPWWPDIGGGVPPRLPWMPPHPGFDYEPMG